MTWKLAGLYIMFAAFICWLVMLSYAVIIGPMSVLGHGIYIYIAAAAGFAIQLVTYVAARIARATNAARGHQQNNGFDSRH
ncbi:hypothetical protein [Dyella jiangningensis]|uniref:Uncharacterized protein n=1 Tax=Dyella jiangningensis TaxID=1379159 RepID=A0A328P3M8_9GAMM|nr:hypothetical protein [Dyella jiangningensis]RAO75891.1 hypothetical protein CA260_17855 [Dyella jiangningensis]